MKERSSKEGGCIYKALVEAKDYYQIDGISLYEGFSMIVVYM